MNDGDSFCVSIDKKNEFEDASVLDALEDKFDFIEYNVGYNILEICADGDDTGTAHENLEKAIDWLEKEINFGKKFSDKARKEIEHYRKHGMTKY